MNTRFTPHPPGRATTTLTTPFTSPIAKLAPNLAKIQYQGTGFVPLAPFFLHRIGQFVKSGYKSFIRKLRNTTRGRVSIPDKIGYPDYDEWIRKDDKVRTFFKDILLDERTLSRGYFNEHYVHRIFRNHMSSKKDYGKELCALLTFELWHRSFVDEPCEKLEEAVTPARQKVVYVAPRVRV